MRVEGFQLTFVCGVDSGLRFHVPTHPWRTRKLQRDLAAAVAASGELCPVVPESYADGARDDRREDEVALRTWNSRSVGTTRIPNGLVRVVDEGVVVPSGDGVAWDAAGGHVTVWPNGVAVVVLDYDLRGAEPLNVARIADEINLNRNHLTSAVIQAVTRVVAALEPAAREVGLEVERVDAPRYVGRHRIVRLPVAPSPEVLDTVKRSLAIVAGDDPFEDVVVDDDRFCYAGNGVSLEIGTDTSASLLRPVAEYYEYWIATACRLDDDLHREFVRLSQADRPDDLVGRRLKDEAQERFFEHRDVLNAMNPMHRAAWESYARTWCIREVEQDVEDKIEVVEQLNHSLRQQVANVIAKRTNALVTFLTALTLVSIVTGVAAFVLTEPRLTVAMRVGLVGASLFASLALFLVSIRPIQVRRD